MIEELLDQVFEKASEYCSKPENSAKLTEKLLNPILQNVALRFQWLFNCLQALAVLVVVQTLLLSWLVTMIRTSSAR